MLAFAQGAGQLKPHQALRAAARPPAHTCARARVGGGNGGPILGTQNLSVGGVSPKLFGPKLGGNHDMGPHIARFDLQMLLQLAFWREIRPKWPLIAGLFLLKVKMSEANLHLT